MQDTHGGVDNIETRLESNEGFLDGLLIPVYLIGDDRVLQELMPTWMRLPEGE